MGVVSVGGPPEGGVWWQLSATTRICWSDIFEMSDFKCFQGKMNEECRRRKKGSIGANKLSELSDVLFVFYGILVFMVLNYSQMTNEGSRTYSIFFVCFLELQQITKPAPWTPSFITKTLQRIQGNPKISLKISLYRYQHFAIQHFQNLGNHRTSTFWNLFSMFHFQNLVGPTTIDISERLK